MEIHEYELEYKPYKTSNESFSINIEIDLDEYRESYAENEFHLRGDSYDYIVDDIVREDKLNFLKGKLEKQIGKKYFVHKSTWENWIQELDNAVEEYNDSIEYYSNNDDEE